MKAAPLFRVGAVGWQPYAGVYAARCRALLATLGARAAAWLAATDSTDATWTTGPLGLALFFDAVERENTDERAARAIVSAVRRALAAATPSRGGLGGAPVGTAAALIILSRGGQRFPRLLASVDRAAREHSGRRLAYRGDATTRASAGMRDFDLMAGAVGMGVYLRLRDSVDELPSADDLAAAWREQLKSTSTRLATQLQDGSRPLVHWGVAHGVAGLIGALCDEPELAAAPATARLLVELERALTADRWGALLPFHSHGPRFRSGWCHGVPGVVATLARRLADGARWSSWRDGLLATAARPLAAQMLDGDDGLCHGLTGLLHCIACAAAVCSDDALAQLRDQIVPHVLDRLERRLAGGNGDFGFLDGWSGIGAVLHAACTAGWPAWHPLLRLASDGAAR